MPIVLTATIVPNGMPCTQATLELRLKEYLLSIEFYLKFAPVFLLENSAYPLQNELERFSRENLAVRRFPLSRNPERGKGYQEFEMLDAWLNSEPTPPPKWLKISGRYQVMNVDSLLRECLQREKPGLLIDQVPRSGVARTHLFGSTTTFYQTQIARLYLNCDDRSGQWIERVLFSTLQKCTKSEVSFFAKQPRIRAVSGSSGVAFPTGRTQWALKQALRSLNRLFDRRYLWYPR